MRREADRPVYRGRFAPSPTGLLHLGGAITAIVCAAAAARVGGAVVLRVEDLDHGRVIPDAEASILDDLAWLGIRFDEGPLEGGPHTPYRQSERSAHYEAALAALAARGLTYLCDCSRAEIARASSAPHVGEEGPRYPGTCRREGMRTRAFRRAPSVRLALPTGATGRFHDVLRGEVEEDVDATVGDFILRRGDGAAAYQLAVVVDDLAMGIREIVRGADLAGSAPRQALLAELLGGELPPVLHVPLLVGEGGERLAKRSHGVPVRDHRAAGQLPDRLVAALARAYGHEVSGSRALEGLTAIFDPSRLPAGPVPLTAVLEGLA